MRSRVMYGAVIGILAVVAVSGIAWAALPKNSVTTRQIKDSTIKTNDIRSGAVRSSDVKDNAVSGADVNESTFGDVPTLAGHTQLSAQTFTATDGADEATARAAAVEDTLLESAPVTITTSCFRDTGTDTVYHEVYVKTSVDGVIMDTDEDDLEGGPLTTDFLNDDTAKDARQLYSTSASNDDTNLANPGSGEFVIRAADGSTWHGWITTGARNGTQATAGAWGTAEHGCLITGGVVYNN